MITKPMPSFDPLDLLVPYLLIENTIKINKLLFIFSKDFMLI